MLVALITVTGTLLGALIGSSLTYFLQRARPGIQVNGIRTSLDHSSSDKTVETNRELGEKLADFGDFSLQFPPSVVSEADYVGALEEAREYLKQSIDVYYPRTIEHVDRLRVLLISRDWERFDDELAKEVRDLWQEARHAVIRSRLSFDEDVDREDANKIHEIVPYNDNNGWVIPLSGPRNLVFSFDHVGEGWKEKVRRQALALAQAISYRDHERVLALVDFLRSRLASDRVTAEVLAAEVERELQPFYRLVIDGVVVNSGRSTIAFSNLGKLVVSMKGFRNNATVVEDDVDVEVSASTLVRVQHTSPDESDPEYGEAKLLYLQEELPILARPGEAVRFRAVSTKALSELPNSEELNQVFSGGNQQCYVILGAIGKKGANFRPIYSANVLFRDLVQTASLPRR